VGIFVIGMHRSGTSMVAGVLERLGVYFGEKDDLVPPNSANELGYYERQRVLALHDALARANRASWRTLPALDFSPQLPGLDDYIAGVREIAPELEAHAPWGLKDPRLSFLLPFWRAHVRNPHVIICVRRPEAVALSLFRRNKLQHAYGAALWELHTLAALKNSESLPRAVVVYEDFIAEPRRAVEALAAQLEAWEGVTPDAAQIEAALHQVRPELDHGNEAPDFESALPYHTQVYEALAQNDLHTTAVPHQRTAVSRELVRLEQAHQTAKTTIEALRNDLTQRTDALTEERARIKAMQERLADLVSWAQLSQPSEARESAQTQRFEEQLETLRRALHAAGQVGSGPLAERYQTLFVEVLELRTQLQQQSVLEQKLLQEAAALAERFAATAAVTAGLSEQLDDAKREHTALRTERDASIHRAHEDKRRLDRAVSEASALRHALEAARAAAAAPTAPASKSAAQVRAPVNGDAQAHAVSRRHSKAMLEIIKSIDHLLSPPLGRFAVPVRQVRGELVRLRAIVASELEQGAATDRVSEQ
jgi:hypothetical protein